MFSEEQLKQYSAVKAPDSLEARVMELNKKSSAKIYAFPKKALSAVAACLAVAIALGAYFSASVDVQLVSAPYQPASYARAVAEEKVVVRLDISGRYEVSVSQGSISSGGHTAQSVELNGEAEIDWLAPLFGERLLTVKKGLIIKQYRLASDEKTQALTLVEV